MKKLLSSLLLLATGAMAQVYQVYPAQPAVVSQAQVNPVKVQQTILAQPAVQYQQAQQPPVVVMQPTVSGFTSPLGFGLFPPLQFPAAEDGVNGIRLSLLYGRNTQVGFLDLSGLVSITDRDFMGLGLSGLWNHVEQNADGLMLAGLGNTVNGNFCGLQLAAFANINHEAYTSNGLQLAMINRAGNYNGIQLGLFNQARLMTGIQLGLINVTEYISGIQFGLVNIIRQSHIPCMILLNIGL